MLKRKLISLTSLIIVGAIALSACGPKTEPTTTSSKGTEGTSSVQADLPSKEKGYFKKYDPPITLSTHASIGVNSLYQDDGSPEKNGWTKWQEENFGIIWKLDWVAPDGQTNTQKLDLAFATGDLPDVIDPSKSQLAKYAAAGKIMPVDDIIEDYASPLVKWAIKDAEERTKGALFLPFTQGGKKYAMPIMKELMDYYNTNFIRDDILKEMGMEIPKTLKEYEAVLEKYKQSYPKGYGLGMDNGLAATAIPMAAYKAYPKHWVTKDNGEIVYGSIQPEARAALEKLAEWFKKGYIDPEFVVKDGNKLQEDVIQGNILTFYGHWASIASPFCGMWDNVPGSSVTAMPNLTGEDGKTGVMANTWFDYSRAITTSCKNPEALMYMMNQNWDSTYRNNQEIRDMMKKDYDYDFFYPVTELREPLNADQVAKDFPGASQPRQLWKYDYPKEVEGCAYFNSFYTIYNALYGFTGCPVAIANKGLGSIATAVNANDPKLLEGDGIAAYHEWNATNKNMATTFATTYNYWSEFEKTDQFKADAFSGAATPAMTEKQAYLDKLELETYTRIIMGTQPITAFDEFVKNWNQNGGEQITKEVNDWSKSLK